MSITQKLRSWWRFLRFGEDPTKEPGDFSIDNKKLIEMAEAYRENEMLWLEEANDSLNPQRDRDAREIAYHWAKIREQTKDFYRRWYIRP